MNKVVEFNQMRFYYKTNVVKYTREKDRLINIYRRAIIVIVDSKTKKTIVHDFTQFIFDKYNKHSIKTQVDYANKIVRFLNYIKTNTSNKSFKTIEIDDINSYLTHISIGNKKETVDKAKQIIEKFIEYLVKKKILINITDNDFCIIEKNYKNKINVVKELKINEIDYACREDIGDIKSRNTHSMEYPLQAMFLNVAFEEVNQIALGIAFQMFGGLRTGEVINLGYSGIQTIGRYGRYGMLVEIRKRDFREDVSLNQAKGYPKKIRSQQIFSLHNILELLLESHIKKYKTNNLEDAIFINSKGKPMTYESYQYYFKKLKKIFLKRLNESENPMLKVQGIILMSKRWGTHIGRGIFTNNNSEFTNPSQLQNIRGDESIETPNTYIDDSKGLSRKLEENAEGAFRELVNTIKESVRN